MVTTNDRCVNAEDSLSCSTVCTSEAVEAWLPPSIPEWPWPDLGIRYVVAIGSVRHGHRRWVLRKPIMVIATISWSDVSCEYEPLHLLGYGKSLAEAIEAIEYDFVVTYDEIVEEDDENLTADAKDLKVALLDIAGYPVLSTEWTTETVPFNPEETEVTELGVM